VTRHPRLFAVAVAGGLAVSAAADGPAIRTTPPQPNDTAEVRFADGSTVRMVLTQSNVDITTRYGKLAVPVADIRRIEFGHRYPDGVEAKINALVGRLALTEARDREAAVRDLLVYRELAYPALRRVAAGTDPDLATRANAAIRQLEEKVGADKMKIRDQDTIHAAEFSVAGRIEAPTLKGQTAYFGEVTVKVAEVRMIRFVGGTGGETELVIDAAKYAAMSQDQWMDTEVDLNEGAELQITATGIVDLYPTGGNYKVGPDAMPRMGTSPDGNPSGMLLGRIGTNGKVFQVGAKYTGTVTDGGRLYLRIACSPWNNASTGSYAVKIVPNGEGGVPAPAPRPPRRGKDDDKDFPPPKPDEKKPEDRK
jgi:hypothetical protein